MKENKDEFYIGYVDDVPATIKKSLKRFVFVALAAMIAIAAIFALTQNTFKNSSFELTTTTQITGVYHEMPYPMLKVQTAENTYKNILLLGFGKSSVNPYLNAIKSEVSELSGSVLRIEGNLIYYNGKTLLQVTSDEKITLIEAADTQRLPSSNIIVKDIALQGEIIDPKCYFGVMKPGKGKIHRSCAVLCISGGIPPVLATTDENNISEYYLITDPEGQPLHKEIAPYVGKPSILTGEVVQVEDWYQLRVDIQTIEDLELPSRIY